MLVMLEVKDNKEGNLLLKKNKFLRSFIKPCSELSNKRLTKQMGGVN